MGKSETKKPSGLEVTTCVAIARILNECQHSLGLHARRVKELVAWRADHKDGFLADFWKCILPIFTIFKREPAVERIVKFVVAFVSYRDKKHGNDCDAFLEEFFGILLFSMDALNKAVRLRACQILSEVVLRLNENAEVSDEVWDDVIESMQKRMQDKVPAVRVYSARALARFANVDASRDLEDDPVLSAYRKALQSDQNAEVRRNIILSMPPSNGTVQDIVRHTADVSEAVRRAAFVVLAMKFPIQSLSIKDRTTVLKRGLHDRKESVQKECLKMLKDVWLARCCQGDPISLLKYLDVETHESVGESVILALLKAEAITQQQDQGLRKYITTALLMNAEEALYWRMLISYLHDEAQAKGHDAATTGGAHAAMNAAVASEKNELLDGILPATMVDYIELLKAHLWADPHLHFVSRQLLLMGKCLDFTDATSRKVAGTFLQDLLLRPVDLGHDESDLDNEVLIGDGLSLGGDKHWAASVAELTWKVYGVLGEFEKIVSQVVADLGKPCREGGADVIQWLNCLAATGFLLENIASLQPLSGNAIEAQEILGGLLLPAAKHVHPEVQRAAIRCLGLFCTRELKPSVQGVQQLRSALTKGANIVQKMASKVLFDLSMWHGAGVLDRVIDFGMQTKGGQLEAQDEDTGLTLLEMLAHKLDVDDSEHDQTEGDTGDMETVCSVIAEGFAKLLLQSRVFPDILPMQHIVLAKLLRLYFNEDTKNLVRLRQCLSMFFETYPSISLDHKMCLTKAFVIVMRSEWPGIYGNESGSSTTVATRKRHATKLSKFMLQLLHQPLFNSDTGSVQVGGDDESESVVDQETPQRKAVIVCDEELAIRIAAEVVGFPSQQRSSAAKSYLATLLRVACSLAFRSSEQQSIKSMRKLLYLIKDMAVACDKQTIKEVDNMANRLRAMDESPEETVSDEELRLILSSMELEDLKLSQQEEQEIQAKTPAPATTRKGRARRRTKRSSTSESSSSSPSPSPPAVKGRNINTPVPLTSVRAHRASKAAAIGKIRSELAPSKRAIYASSDEELSSSSSGSEGEEQADSEFELESERQCGLSAEGEGEAEEDEKEEQGSMASPSQSESAVLSESPTTDLEEGTSCPIPTADHVASLSFSNDENADEKEVEVIPSTHNNRARGKQRRAKRREDTAEDALLLAGRAKEKNEL